MGTVLLTLTDCRLTIQGFVIVKAPLIGPLLRCLSYVTIDLRAFKQALIML